MIHLLGIMNIHGKLHENRPSFSKVPVKGKFEIFMPEEMLAGPKNKIQKDKKSGEHESGLLRVLEVLENT